MAVGVEATEGIAAGDASEDAGRWHDGRTALIHSTAAAADLRQQDVTESAAEDAVDEEVGRRVKNDQQVANVWRVDERMRTLDAVRLVDRLEDCQNAVWCVTDDDYHHDDNYDDRDVFLVNPAFEYQKNSSAYPLGFYKGSIKL